MQDNKLLRVEGAVENIVFRNDENGYTVLELADGDDYITAVGIMPLVSAGDNVVLFGTFTEHKSYGRQFAAQTCEVTRPTGAADILRYLSSGAVKGVGAATARRLVDEFGEATLEIMENEPDRVAMLKGISRAKALEFAAQLKSDESVRALMIYLGGFGIGNTASIKIFKALGGSAVEQIKENPYLLCEGDFSISFETADIIAKHESLDENSELRLRAGIAYILRHNEGNGHTCLPRVKVESMAAGFLRVRAEDISDCVEKMCFDRTLVPEQFDEKEFLYLQAMHMTEIYIASRIKLLKGFPAEQLKGVEDANRGADRGSACHYGRTGYGQNHHAQRDHQNPAKQGTKGAACRSDGKGGAADVRADGAGGKDHPPPA